MRSQKLKFLSIFVAAMYLHGCGYATVSVYNIGARSKHGEYEVYIAGDQLIAKDNNLKIDIYDSDLTTKIGQFATAYSGYEDTKKIGELDLAMDKNEWISHKCNSSSSGTIDGVIDGKSIKFDGSTRRGDRMYTCVVHLDHIERKWYGYPAQSLMALSIPIDIAVIAGFVVYSYVSLPFTLLYHSFTMEKGKG